MRQPTRDDLSSIAHAAAQGNAVAAPRAGDLQYRTFPGFDPSSATLLPPSIAIGHCLEPAFACYAMLIFDRGVQPYDGAFVWLMLRAPEVLEGRPTFAAKLMRRVGSSWYLVSNEGVHDMEQLKGSIVEMSTLVAAIEFGPDWPRTNEFEIPDHIRGLGITVVPACPLWSADGPPSIDGLGIRLLPGHERRADVRSYALGE
jgi:hypothetical protein